MARRLKFTSSNPDPVFAAEMRALADARKAAAEKHVGDGMAVMAPHWMGFGGGQRVPPPKPSEDWFDVRKHGRSTLKRAGDGE